MREGTFNTTQSTLLRRKCPEAHLTPSQDLAMWTAFDLVYVPLGDQCSQFWESLWLGYPVWIPRSTGKEAAKARTHWIFFFLDCKSVLCSGSIWGSDTNTCNSECLLKFLRPRNFKNLEHKQCETLS